jgi:hypothetical protein
VRRLACALAIAIAAAGCASHRPSAASASAFAADAARAPEYTALGSGHLLRTVTGGGRFLTLEDGSRWDVLPSDQFNSADWNPDDTITVRPARADDEFTYELLNTTEDEGVRAKFIPKS